MTAGLTERIKRARQLLETTHHAALATVNVDGTPHGSPVFIAFDRELRPYWASDPEAQHSQNIARSGRVFIMLFESDGSGEVCISGGGPGSWKPTCSTMV